MEAILEDHCKKNARCNHDMEVTVSHPMKPVIFWAHKFLCYCTKVSHKIVLVKGTQILSIQV